MGKKINYEDMAAKFKVVMEPLWTRIDDSDWDMVDEHKITELLRSIGNVLAVRHQIMFHSTSEWLTTPDTWDEERAWLKKLDVDPGDGPNGIRWYIDCDGYADVEHDAKYILAKAAIGLLAIDLGSTITGNVKESSDWKEEDRNTEIYQFVLEIEYIHYGS